MARRKLDPAQRKELQRSARQIAKERANREYARQVAAREALNRAEPNVDNDYHLRVNKVIAGLRSTLALVASSYPTFDNSIPIAIATKGRYGMVREVNAWTDFERIVVEYPASNFRFDEHGDPDRVANRSSIREVLGIGYHEIGHCLYSEPFTALGLDATLKHAWNVLEDQRMELAVTDVSPDIAAYFTITVLRNIINNQVSPGEAWWLVAGRLYLPRSLRNEIRAEFAREHGDDVATKVRAVVRQYCVARTTKQRAKAVQAFQRLIEKANGRPRQDSGKHEFCEKEDGGTSEACPSPQWAEDDEQEQSEEADSSAESSEDSTPAESTVVEGSGTGEGGNDATSTQPSEPAESAPQFSEEDDWERQRERLDRIREQAEQVRDDAIEQIEESGLVDKAFGEISAAEEVARLPYETPTSWISDDQQVIAHRVADEFREALDTATAFNTPVWRRHQEHGVVDPLSYRTRRAGDPCFRRERTGDGGRGLDASISLVLDVSGSMGNDEEELSIAAFGVKSACWELGVPCSVTVYSSHARILSTSKDAPQPWLIRSGGFTSLEPALDACLGQREDAKDHLVLILTDGLLDDGERGVQQLKESGAYVIGVSLRNSSGLASLNSIGAHEAFYIENALQLAEKVESFLTNVVAAA